MNSSGQTVHVDLGSRSYDISIDAGNLPQIAELTRLWLGRSPDQPLRCFIVTDTNVLQPHANAVKSALSDAGAEVQVVCVKAGEASKSLAEASDLYDELVDFRADRKTVVLAVGGGVVGDLAGFVAATYARGLLFVQVPTTLLAMVDSSVGGKTGVNHPRGKNLIGSFHQPAGVLIDTDTMATLPDREYRSGLAEVIKYGVIQDTEFFNYLENNIVGLNERDPAVLRQVVARCCELKALVVKEDEYETTGLRAILNYGHTYAHAFEALAGYGVLLHGEAVSIGMLCGSRLAKSLGRIGDAEIQRQVDLLTAVQLPVDVPQDLQAKPDEILKCMLLDKKTVAGDLKFVLPDRIGHVDTIGGIDTKTIVDCLSS
ncbi:MAG TPA: 3-dehydroquinate synthase [Planctomycetes bacterium]|nr:3-dehydroquinate synthase [Planctomycetota bacterium]